MDLCGELKQKNQKILDSGRRVRTIWDDEKYWCGHPLPLLPIFVMPCCCRRMHLACFERWVKQLRAEASESYVICGIANHFHTGRRTCQCGSEISRFAEPKVWMEQQDKLRKDKIAGVDVRDEGWLTDVALANWMAATGTVEGDQWKDMRQDFFMP